MTARQTIAECLRLPFLRARLAELNAVVSWSDHGMSQGHKDERQRVAEEVERVERALGLLPDDDPASREPDAKRNGGE